MLFPYTYVPHQMEKMQTFIDFIFHEVWCKAPAGEPYSLDLFNASPELHEVMKAFHYDDSKGAEFFSGHVERIYILFAALSNGQIEQFRQWYRANNNIEEVCANDPTASVIRYADLPAELKDVRDQLKPFFKDLYSHLDLAALKAKVGEIGDHYDKAFLSANQTGKCPFCGISDIKGPDHTKREAYDHYLPKALYPFNSVNFRNLAPACHECNSTYKLSKDPAHNNAGRRKVFYPYAAASHAIEITIDLGAPDIDQLTAADIQIAFGPAAVHEEIATWLDVYGIDERYKAKCCSGDAKDWLEQVRILRDAHGVTPEASLAALQLQTVKAPVANSNFLKRAFLEGCQRAGLFDELAGMEAAA
jgi:hypothetical protein